MKKMFLMAAVAGVALASCTNDESVLESAQKSREINFQPVEYSAQTRAEHDGTTYNGGTISVYAWKYGADDVFMNAVELTAGGAINNGDVYYWPSFALDFAAFTPIGSPVNVARSSGATTLTYTFDSNTPNPANVNYMYSDFVSNQSSGTVALLFRHAMANVNVKVVKAADTNSAGDEISVELKSAKIVGLKNQGQFVVNGSDNLTSRYWAYPAGSAEVVIASNVSELSTTGESLANYYAMPQAFTDDAKFVLNYVVTIDPTNGPAIVTEYTKEIKLSSIALTQSDAPTGATDAPYAGNAGWGTNKKISYQISINPSDLTPITFSVAEETWGAVAGANQTLN